MDILTRHGNVMKRNSFIWDQIHITLEKLFVISHHVWLLYYFCLVLQGNRDVRYEWIAKTQAGIEQVVKSLVSFFGNLNTKENPDELRYGGTLTAVLVHNDSSLRACP